MPPKRRRSESRGVDKVALKLKNNQLALRRDHRQIEPEPIHCLQVCHPTDASNVKFECVSCLRVFKESDDAEGHLVNDHGWLGRLHCPVCEDEEFTVFRNTFEGMTHMEEYHSSLDIKPHDLIRLIPVDELSSDEEQDGVNPEATSELTPWQCFVCERTITSSLKYMRHHIKKCINYNTYNCSRCSFAAPHRRDIVRHFRTHDKKEELPSLIEFDYSVQVSLSIENWLDRLIQLVIKEKYFIDLQRLINEDDYFPEQLIYSCPLCRGKKIPIEANIQVAFTTPEHLMNHMCTHIFYRPYRCSACMQEFTTERQILDHGLQIHKKITAYTFSPIGALEFYLEKVIKNEKERHEQIIKNKKEPLSKKMEKAVKRLKRKAKLKKEKMMAAKLASVKERAKYLPYVDCPDWSPSNYHHLDKHEVEEDLTYYGPDDSDQSGLEVELEQESNHEFEEEENREQPAHLLDSVESNYVDKELESDLIATNLLNHEELEEEIDVKFDVKFDPNSVEYQITEGDLYELEWIALSPTKGFTDPNATVDESDEVRTFDEFFDDVPVLEEAVDDGYQEDSQFESDFPIDFEPVPSTTNAEQIGPLASGSLSTNSGPSPSNEQINESSRSNSLQASNSSSEMTKTCASDETMHDVYVPQFGKTLRMPITDDQFKLMSGPVVVMKKLDLDVLLDEDIPNQDPQDDVREEPPVLEPFSGQEGASHSLNNSSTDTDDLEFDAIGPIDLIELQSSDDESDISDSALSNNSSVSGNYHQSRFERISRSPTKLQLKPPPLKKNPNHSMLANLPKSPIRSTVR